MVKIFRCCNLVSLGWIIRNFYLGIASMKSMARETLQTFLHFFKTVIKVFKAFKVFAPCLKNEPISQATRVSPDYTHRLAVCAHFERHLPLSLWSMVLQTSESVYHLNL